MKYDILLDNNECTDETHTCGNNSECENEDPGYSCTCDAGYNLESDERTCTG